MSSLADVASKRAVATPTPTLADVARSKRGAGHVHEFQQRGGGLEQCDCLATRHVWAMFDRLDAIPYPRCDVLTFNGVLADAEPSQHLSAGEFLITKALEMVQRMQGGER